MSFMAGGLLYHESLKIAQLYEEVGDWEVVRNQVVQDNLLQMRTIEATKRIFREICPRVQLLTEDQFDLLLTGTRQEQPGRLPADSASSGRQAGAGHLAGHSVR